MFPDHGVHKTFPSTQYPTRELDEFGAFSMSEERRSPQEKIESSSRLSATLLLDHELRCVAHSKWAAEWVGYSSDVLQGTAVTAVLPELAPYHAALQALLSQPDAVFMLPRPPIRRYERLFDIQAEQSPFDAHQLLLTLIVVSSEAEDLRVVREQTSARELHLLDERNRALMLLNRAGRVLTATLEMDKVLERLLQVATQIVGAEGGSVWLWEDVTDPAYLICRAAVHPPHDVSSLVGQRVAYGQGIAGWAAKTGETAVVDRTVTDPRFYPQVDARSGFKTDSLVAVPLKLREKVIGVLELVNKRSGNFLEHDLTIAETLAASASIAIENARLVTALQRQMGDLESHNEELDAFDHTVAHNLQNPLSLLIGFAEVLQQIAVEMALPSDLQEVVKAIVINGRRMSSIIKELLLLSSVRKSDVDTEPMQMDEIVESALDRVAHLRSQYQVEITLPDQWPTAIGHSAWIEEVWENYLSNAIKYGGRPPKIELGAEVEADGMVRFWVRDNGQGIAADKMEQLFMPFTQLSEIKVTGHGLGLSIVERIIDKLNGRVDVESGLGEGSTFSFYLPAAAASVRHAPTAVPS